jgi:hypothetical protein
VVRPPGTAQLEADRPLDGPSPIDDVGLEIFHRRVQDLFDRPEPVDLVDEQHVAVVEIGRIAARSLGSAWSAGPLVSGG